MAGKRSSRQKGKPLQIRFQTVAERAKVDADAARDELPTSTYARNVLLGVKPPRQTRRPSAQRQDVAHCLSTLGRVASTLRDRAPEVAASLEADLQAVGTLLRQALRRRHDH
jgi:hypothetical protein